MYTVPKLALFSLLLALPSPPHPVPESAATSTHTHTLAQTTPSSLFCLRLLPHHSHTPNNTLQLGSGLYETHSRTTETSRRGSCISLTCLHIFIPFVDPLQQQPQRPATKLRVKSNTVTATFLYSAFLLPSYFGQSCPLLQLQSRKISKQPCKRQSRLFLSCI